MRNIWVIAKRELNAYFYSPIAYVVTTIFVLVSGFFFHKSKEQGYKKPKPLNNDLIDVNIRCYFSQVSNT